MAFAYRNQHKVDLDVVICVRFWAFGTSGAQNQESYLRETLFSKTLFWKYSSFSNILKYTKIINPPYASEYCPETKTLRISPHHDFAYFGSGDSPSLCFQCVRRIGVCRVCFWTSYRIASQCVFLFFVSQYDFLCVFARILISRLRVFEYSFYLSL